MIVPKNVHLEFSLAHLAYDPLDQSVPIEVVVIFILIRLLIRRLRGRLGRILPSLHCAVFARLVQAEGALDLGSARLEASKTTLVLVNFSVRVARTGQCEYLIVFIEQMSLSIYI